MASTSAQGEQSISSLPGPSVGVGPVGSTPNDFHRRIFIGPMPEKVIAHTEGQGKKAKLTVGSVLSFSFDNQNEHTKADKTEEVTQILKENAFRFFVHHGGNPDEWDDEEEQNLIEHMSKLWKESDWGQIWSRRHHRRKHDPQGANSRWFGKSFEVGSLLGMNVMHDADHIVNKSLKTGSERVSSKRSHSHVDPDGHSTSAARSTTSGMETFSTPRSSFMALPESDGVQPKESGSPVLNEATEAGSSTSSRTGLLLKTRAETTNSGTPQRTIEIIPQSEVQQSSLVDPKGKARMVHYNEDTDGLTPTPTPASGPVPPETVLQRTKDTVDPNTSLAATLAREPTSGSSEDLIWGDVVLRGD
uniref:Uncharacterized protein n=1 Tax=Psilocybe cubensis TaxID=181762 RepID=A0A8H7Y0N6_PSICU